MKTLLAIGLTAVGLTLPIFAAAEPASYRPVIGTSLIQRLLRVSGSRPLLVRRVGNRSPPRSQPAASAPSGVTGLSSPSLPPRVIELTQRFELSLSADGVPSPRAIWTPPKRLLLDRVRRTVAAPEQAALVREQGVTGTGRGIAIAIVDSGVDLRHPDLRDLSGGTRVAWLLEFGAGPFGFYPELEATYGCDRSEIRCGILGEKEINTLIAGRLDGPNGGQISLPRDVIGHGTHVASLAAGNGASNSRYVGIAPEATLIVAQVAQNSVSVSDADVVLATKFAFERAHELQMPAVVNLSLGGDFGPHDGSSAIGEALTDFLDEPGRAIVVAAGNSGGLIAAESSRFPGPHGIHTEVNVLEEGSVRVPLLMPPGAGALNGAVFVWVSTRPGDDLRVGVEDDQGRVAVVPQARGHNYTAAKGATEVSVIHESAAELGIDTDGELGAAIVLDGELQAGSTWTIRLEGQGTAALWVQATGGLGPEAGGGVVFPRATRAQTVNVPADSPELISVGATLNRTTWPTASGDLVRLVAFDEDLELRADSVAFFSSAGPTSNGVLKPDIVAPGAAVVGALSDAAQPLSTRRSIFAFSPLCQAPACAVVDDAHAVTLGTSMAAPIVSGAVALLFEQEPTLTQRQVKALLQSGAADLSLAQPTGTPNGLRATSTQLGAGRLDLLRSAKALLIQQGVMDAKSPSKKHTRLILSDEFARPGAGFTLRGLLQLRDADGEVAHAEKSDLRLSVGRGRVTAPLTSDAPGVYWFEVAADEDTGGRTLDVNVHFREEPLAQRALPIAVDNGVFVGGAELVGGCALSANQSKKNAWALWIAAALLVTQRLRRRASSRRRAEKRRTLPPRVSTQTTPMK